MPFCVYDRVAEAPRIALAASLPAGGSWSPQATGFKFASGGGAPDGLTKAKLKAGPRGTAKVAVSGKLSNPPPLPLAQGPEVVVQLVSADGACWEARFSNSPEAQRPQEVQGSERVGCLFAALFHAVAASTLGR